MNEVAHWNYYFFFFVLIRIQDIIVHKFLFPFRRRRFVVTPWKKTTSKSKKLTSFSGYFNMIIQVSSSAKKQKKVFSTFFLHIFKNYGSLSRHCFSSFPVWVSSGIVKHLHILTLLIFCCLWVHNSFFGVLLKIAFCLTY